ncbi:hypothetical protein J3A83DRAFT_4195538 [Scleroderma citrinum]
MSPVTCHLLSSSTLPTGPMLDPPLGLGNQGCPLAWKIMLDQCGVIAVVCIHTFALHTHSLQMQPLQVQRTGSGALFIFKLVHPSVCLFKPFQALYADSTQWKIPDNFSFGQPSSSVNVQDDAMTASKFNPPYIIPCHHSASQHVFPSQNSWEEPLELSGGTMCNANPFEDIDWNDANIQAFLKEALNTTPSTLVSAVLTPPANQLPCPKPHFLPPSSPLPVPTSMSNMSPLSETQFQPLPSELKNPSLPTSCITDEWKQKEATLLKSVKKLAEELSQKIADIAQEHSVTVKKISKLLTGHINYKKLHEVSFSNTLIWAKALKVNAACPPGSKYSLIQLCQMVAEDPSLQNLDNEAKAQLKDKLWQHQAEKGTSVCATNAAATCDVHTTMDKIIQDVCIYATLFITRGHSYNMYSATWYSTDNAMDFWEDILKLELDQVTKQFELWGCSWNKSNQTQLNYNKFNSTIKLKHGINKKGWPEAMSSGEHQDFMKDLKVCQESGEIVKPSCKKCFDAGVPHKHKLTKQSGCQLKQTKNRRAAKSHEYISSMEEETEDGNEEGMDK